MNRYVETISRQVQNNCHIADARHGGDYTMCTYLLKMREFFRWEQGLGFDAPLGREELGDWLGERERLWESLQEAEFHPLTIAGQVYDPFETRQINRAIEPLGLVYSAGLVNGARPHFYLGELLSRENRDDDFTLHISGAEYARCLNAPPAMASDAGIFLRLESLRRFLWEKYESWGWNRADNALGRAFACYPFDTDPEKALDRMADNEMAAAREHELGEYEASQLLGEGWNRMLMDLRLTQAELMARAVKDHIADCSRTLPLLLESGAEASIHFYVGNLSGMRKHLFPELQEAYARWREEDDDSSLRFLSKKGVDYWLELAREMLALHAELGARAADPIRELVQQHCLGEGVRG